MSRLPVAVTLLCIIVFGAAFFSVSWPYVDAYSSLNEAARWTWGQYIPYAFAGGTEYRPLLRLGVKLSYELVGLHLWWYQALVLAQFAAVLALLAWLFWPIGARRGVAASIALACIVGLHTSRILFLFAPLNAYSGALLFLLVALALTFDQRTRAYDWIFLPLTFVALLLLESSLLIAPLIVVLWWLKAPGASTRAVAAVATAVGCYFVVRFSFGVAEGLRVYTDSGLGFSALDPQTLRDTFQHAPWVFWIYNVFATFMTVVASEPRAGIYQFVAALVSGSTQFWQWWHTISSLLTTSVIVVGLAVGRPAAARDRLLIATGVVLIVCGSALGFLYTRDRIAFSAGIGYGMLLYVALAALLERLPASGWKQRLALASVGALAIAWAVRGTETYYQLRDTAWDFHLEWTTRYGELAGPVAQHTDVLASMRSAALRFTPVDPQLDSGWTYTLFERRFGLRPGFVTSESVEPPLSPPFEIRWRPEVDAASRTGLEAELNLTEPQPARGDDDGRTWTYHLHEPTPDRVRKILSDSAVEDTVGIDAARLEIRGTNYVSQVVSALRNGSSIVTGDVSASIDVRAKSLGPGFCRTTIRSGTNTIGILTPPLGWSDWTTIDRHVGGVMRTYSTESDCQAGAEFEVRYFR